MADQPPKCQQCGTEMKIIPSKPDDRKRLRHVEGKGTYFPYKCEKPECGAEREIFVPYKSG